MFFCVSCISHDYESVLCCLVVTCWERADLMDIVGDVYCIFVIFSYDILGQVWYLIISLPNFTCILYVYTVGIKISRTASFILNPIGYKHAIHCRINHVKVDFIIRDKY